MNLSLDQFPLLRMMHRLLSSAGHPRRRPRQASNSVPGKGAESHIVRRSSTIEHLHPTPALSPFDRLPVELHAEIFSHCLEPFPHLGDTDKPPMTIARVCSAWKTLVLSTPKLWASFEIDVQDCESLEDFPDALPDPMYELYAVHLLRSVQIWLERSRKPPPLCAARAHALDTRARRLSAQLMAMFVAHARRWRAVEFVLPSTSLDAVQTLFPEEFPALKQLKIHMKGQWNAGGGAGARTFPWAQLTSLDLRLDAANLLNLDEYLALLQDATNLVSCSINANCCLSATADSTRSHSGGRNGDPLLNLPALESLHLVLQGGFPSGSLALAGPAAAAAGAQTPFLRPEESFTTFLAQFTGCRKLAQLELDWLVDAGASQSNSWADSSSVSFTSLQATLRALSPSLHSIRFAYLPLGEEQLHLALAELGSGLTALDLRFPLADHERDPITDRFLKSLTLPSQSGVQAGPSCSESLKGSTQSDGAGMTSEWDSDAGGPSQAQRETPSFPGLEQLTLHCSGERCAARTLLKLVESRMDGVRREKSGLASLKQLHLYTMSPILPDASRYTGKWRKAGLEASIESVVFL
ncbi:hypothetical protein DFP72DRAFT_875794 [Ephemerocybe angulata]|uniref:F-box domain-containing protein n=1 Tax=Ephemerocybe angulata TaxID=980116 RepID=A0A8H6MFL7_9AGAR|nr:hypothetical protein DFP72DRAFT_875794 [Tulosesus angulatus]